MKMQNMKRGETTEQITLFNWANNNLHALPCLALMYHVPNEGKRTNGAVLKAAGMKSGVPDVVLPVPCNGFHGLYLEMKYGKNKTTAEQEAFMTMLRQQGYKTAVAYGFEDAKAEILAYLQEPGKMPLEKCLASPWIAGKCDGVQMPGRMFAKTPCRECAKHEPTRAERTIEENMAAVQEQFKRPITKAIADLSAGKAIGNLSLEDTLETINQNLAFLVRGQELTVEQSAAVLTVAMEAYKKAKGSETNA